VVLRCCCSLLAVFAAVGHMRGRRMQLQVSNMHMYMHIDSHAVPGANTSLAVNSQAQPMHTLEVEKTHATPGNRLFPPAHIRSELQPGLADSTHAPFELACMRMPPCTSACVLYLPYSEHCSTL
jgi:hypothetical protein